MKYEKDWTIDETIAFKFISNTKFLRAYKNLMSIIYNIESKLNKELNRASKFAQFDAALYTVLLRLAIVNQTLPDIKREYRKKCKSYHTDIKYNSSINVTEAQKEEYGKILLERIKYFTLFTTLLNSVLDLTAHLLFCFESAKSENKQSINIRQLHFTKMYKNKYIKFFPGLDTLLERTGLAYEKTTKRGYFYFNVYRNLNAHNPMFYHFIGFGKYCNKCYLYRFRNAYVTNKELKNIRKKLDIAYKNYLTSQSIKKFEEILSRQTYNKKDVFEFCLHALKKTEHYLITLFNKMR